MGDTGFAVVLSEGQTARRTGGVEDTEVFRVNSTTGAAITIMFSYNDTPGDHYFDDVDGGYEFNQNVDIAFVDPVGMYFCNEAGDLPGEATCYIFTERLFDLLFQRDREELADMFPYIQVSTETQHYEELKRLVQSMQRASTRN